MSEKQKIQPGRRQVDFQDLIEPLEEFCAATGRTLADVVRSGTAKEIGRKDLLKNIKGPGRPSKGTK